MAIRFSNISRLYSICAVLSLAALTGVMSPPAAAYCSYCNCTAYNDYIPDASFGGCVSSGCFYVCARPSLIAWSPQLTGIEVSDEAQPVVVAVYRNSPADRAGVRIGDTILEINGKPLPYTCSLSEGAVQKYVIKRGTQKINVAMRAVSATEILLRATDPQFSEVALKHSESVHSFLPYISGAILRKTSHGFLVKKILPGTPAEAAGLKRGFRVLSILDASTGQPSTAGEGADYRADLIFVLASGGAKTTKTLRLQALSEVLRGIGSPRVPTPLSASLFTGVQ